MSDYARRRLRCYEFEYVIPWEDIVEGMRESDTVTSGGEQE